MKISKEIAEEEGIKKAVILMGTELNKELIRNFGFKDDNIENAAGNDLVIALEGEEDMIAAVYEKIHGKLKETKVTSTTSGYFPKTIDSAVKTLPGANIALISVPGEYAHLEAHKALDCGLNVMIFSDNVALEHELELKKKGLEKGLLVMGPDCGTAIINGAPFAFANLVRKGNIGIVGASGTGIQEVSTIIHKWGGGVSHCIGTGGRDLSDYIGGITLKMGLEALEEDPNTGVIVVISKPPSDKVAAEILDIASQSKKPVVFHFIGKTGEGFTDSLESAALKALELSGIKVGKTLNPDAGLIEKELPKKAAGQEFLRGFFTGGTLASEAVNIVSAYINKPVYSNVSKEYKYKEGLSGDIHYILDLGDDQYTVGRPHPMIDPYLRGKMVEQAGKDPFASVILLDFVLGYGSHEDPTGAMIPAIKKAVEVARDEGRHLTVVASICGTEEDPQDLNQQKQKLLDAGVLVFDTNKQAAEFAVRLIKG
jgi:FdrA protein